jgi:ribosome-binding protein aMBF1 (putative translation factor)
MDEPYGKIIRQYRRSAEVAQADVAKVIKRSQFFISRVERGRANPTEAERKKIEKFLGVPRKDRAHRSCK